MAKKLIGLVGFIGSGKGTVGDYLVSKYNFTSVSFAASLKDAVSAIFRWPRHLLEGDTKESREWREVPDIFWSKKFGRDITPRWVLQHLGTNVLRNNFFDDIWIASLEKLIVDFNEDTVITDVRFPNEIKMIRNQGGQLWWVQRGDLPIWYDVEKSDMPNLYPDIHSSEYSWTKCDNFDILDNNLNLNHLYLQIENLIK